MTDEELVKYHRDMWKALPDELKIKAVLGLRDIMEKDGRAIGLFRTWIEESPTKWWCRGNWHFYGGMKVRNILRSVVGILDDQLPSGNWDDYYIMAIEQAVRVDTYVIEGTEKAGNAYDDWDTF